VSPNAFIGKPEPPSDAELSAALGAAKPLWDQLLYELARHHNLTVQEWNSYSPKAGWSLRLKLKDRNIVYLAPRKGCFLASFALGDKAVAAARQSDLPPGVLKIINEARRYAEGTAVRLEIETAKDIQAATKLAGIKLTH
jgi:Protein of unknown function (DUF3788)